MKRIFAALAFIALATAGCAQAPTPTKGYNTVWTWTAPSSTPAFAGCGTAAGQFPCSYILSVETISGTTCDPATSANYKQLNPGAPVAALTFTQDNTTGETVCAVVTTVWNAENSPPSAPSAPVTSPQVPLAPGIPAGNAAQSASLERPTFTEPAPSPQLASMAVPVQVVGRIVRVR